METPLPYSTNRSVLAPQQPIRVGTAASSLDIAAPSSPVVVARRAASPMLGVGQYASGCCAPPMLSADFGCGVTVSEREYLLPGPQACCIPPQPLPIVSEQFIGRKVDILEHERVVKALEQRIMYLETQLTSSRQPNPEVPLLKAKIQSLESQLAALSGVQGSVETLRAENRHLEGIIHDLESRARANADLAERCSRLAVESRQIDNELQNALRTRDQALFERDQLARQLGGAEEDLLQGAAGVRAVKSQMQIRISQLEAELQELIATLRLRDNEVKELTCQLRQRDGHSVDFDRLKADNITLIREVERSAEDVRQLEMEVARLRAELHDCRSAHHGPLPATGPSRPMLGVEIKMLDDAAGHHDNVVVVHTVTPHGPAEAAGIVPGDILKEWDGMLLDSKPKFQRLVDQTPPGTRIMLTVIRGKSILDVPVTMGSAPTNFSHHRRVVHSATRVDNAVQDQSYGSIHSGGGVHGSGSRTRGSRMDTRHSGRYGY